MRFRALARFYELLREPGALGYLRQSGKRSLASYRLCRAVRALIGEPATVFDVGANQGQFANAAAWWFPRAHIVSFEPSPAVLPALRKNLSRLPNSRVVASALGEAAGELEFFENEYSPASSALPMAETQRRHFPETAKVRKVVVPVTTLDAFTAGQTWPRPLLLKLDVQGFEKRVLAGAGAFLPAVDYLLFECSYRPMYEGEADFGEMLDFAKALGFELVAPVGFLESEDHVILQTDLLWRRRR